MSDKTKYYADQARMARRMAATPPQEVPVRCPCGAAAVLADHGPRGALTLYCTACAPADLLALAAALSRF